MGIFVGIYNMQVKFMIQQHTDPRLECAVSLPLYQPLSAIRPPDSEKQYPSYLLVKYDVKM